MKAIEFAALVQDARQRADGVWSDAKCPAHNDQRASLSFRDGDLALVVECHAGCTRGQIAGALGLTVADLSHHTNGRPPHRGARGRIVATYDYHDEHGVLLYQAVRYEPKDFRQRKPDGVDGWSWKLGDVPRVLYRLPEVLRVSARTGEGVPDWVAWLEGRRAAQARAAAAQAHSHPHA